MRIAILADPLDNQRAGVHVYTRQFIQALVDHGSDDHEYILIRSKVGDAFPSLRQIVVPNTTLPIGWASFRLFVLVPRVCRKLKVDAVFEPAHFGPFNLPRSIKRITMIHDLTPILFPQYHRWHSQWLQKRFLPGILRRADLVLANSAHTRKDLMAYQPEVAQKTIAIPLGIDTRFQPVEDAALFQRYLLPQRYFLYLGTLEPRKNLLTLLEAFQHYRAQGGKTELVLAGKMGWKNTTLLRALTKNEFRQYIHLPGYMASEDLPALYSHAVGFVYPSEYEGFGFPVLEAMACGVPVMVAANSSLLEVGGDAAYYFPTHDSRALAQLMEEVETHTDSVRLETARRHAATFTWANYVRSWETALQQLI